MVLKEGGPCVGVLKAGGTCGKTQAHIWYGGPLCKACYERRHRALQGKRPRVGASEAAEEEASGGDNLLEVIKVSGCRSRRPSALRRSLGPTLPLTRAPPIAHRLSAIAPSFLERSNPPESDDDEEPEYDIYGWFNFESDAPGVKRLDRQWVQLPLAVEAEGWEEALEAFKEKVQIKEDALQ